MSHVRKDTLTKPPQWWKHLRSYYKRVVSKRERRVSKKEIRKELIIGELDERNK